MFHSPAAPPAARWCLADVYDRGVLAEYKYFGGSYHLRVFAVVEHIGTIAPQPRHDDLAAFGMRPDLARQAEQPQRIVEVEILRRYVLGDRRPLRLLAVAKLDIDRKSVV